MKLNYLPKAISFTFFLCHQPKRCDKEVWLTSYYVVRWLFTQIPKSYTGSRLLCYPETILWTLCVMSDYILNRHLLSAINEDKDQHDNAHYNTNNHPNSHCYQQPCNRMTNHCITITHQSSIYLWILDQAFTAKEIVFFHLLLLNSISTCLKRHLNKIPEAILCI